MRILITLFICFGLAVQGYTQNFKYDPQPKGVKLPVQNVLQMEQDTLGRMWFSTPLGVVYSDGIESFTLPDSILKEFNYLISIHKDEDGIIWIYNSDGLPKLVKGGYGQWELIDLGIKFDEKYSSGISFSTLGKGNEKRFFIDTKYQLLYWNAGSAEKTLINRDFDEQGILGSVNLFENKVYLYYENGTYLLSGNSLEEVSLDGIPLPSSPFIVKRNPEDGNYYFLGREYLAKGKNPFTPESIVDQKFSKDQYYSMNMYGLFFEGKSIFYHFNSQLFKASENYAFPLIIDLEDELRVYSINGAMVDREGILWVGTSRGLVNFNSLVFQNYGSGQTTLLAEEISAIGNLGNGEYLFGFNNGIQKYSRLAVKTVYRDPYPDGNPTNRIVNFSNDGKGSVWFSSNWAGVGRYDIKSGVIRHFLPPPGVNVSSVNANNDTLIITGSNDLFLFPLKAGLSRMYENNKRNEIIELLQNDFFYLRKAGRLSDGRLMVMKAGQLANEKPFLANNHMMIADGYDFLELNNNQILLGTETGLKILENGQVRPYPIQGELITRPVFAMLKDSKERIWFGTDDGVYLSEKDRLLHFNESNGLIGNEINRGALIEASSGRIMIGTLKGFSLFFTDEEFLAEGAPKVYINKLLMDDQVLQPEEPNRMPFSQNSLEIQFSAIGFNQVKDLWVHYRLGPDRDWEIIRDPKTSSLFLPNLPYGDYQVELKASYEGQNFSEEIKSMPFTILKPLYLQTWFIILWVLFLIALGILINIFFQQFRKVGVLKTAFDQKSIEKQLAEEQFKNVWSSSKDGLILTLEGEIILTANPSFAQLVNKEITELENTKVMDLFSDSDYYTSYIESFLRQVLKKREKGLTYESRVPWKSGTVEMEVYSVLIQEDFGGKKLILSVFRDISAKKAIEQKLRDAKSKAEQANRYKTSMLSNISHEIRTPLNGILGGTEHIMMMRQDDPELISQLDIILQSGERLLTTITAILDMAKIEANKMNVLYTEVDINEFLATIIAPLKNLAMRKGLTLKAEFLKSPFHGKIDKRFMEMIVNNLVSNAIKYTEKGIVKLTVDRRKNNLLLSIEDSGVGMSEDFLKKAFQPFEQESSGNDRLYEGTGLGLNITKNLISLLHGEINLQSSKNTGTVVTIEIPLPEA